MKEFLKKGLSFFFMGCLIAASSIVVLAADNQTEVPNYAQPNSVAIYDDNLKCHFESGGEVTNSEGSGVIVKPGIKAVYDKRGLLRNVYYRVPWRPGSPKDQVSYQLSDPDTQRKVPNYAQPNSVVIYDDNLEYHFERGGKTNISEDSYIMVESGMKVVYDKNGLLRNVYYSVPNKPGSYQLDDYNKNLINYSYKTTLVMKEIKMFINNITFYKNI